MPKGQNNYHKITSVAPGSIAEELGVEPGDLLISINDQEIEEISALPSKDALYAKVLGTMIAPITGLAVCLGQILEQKGGSLGEPEAAAE